jgi:hypothetical protein
VPRALEASLREDGPHCLVADKPLHRGSQAFGIIGIDEKTRVADDFGQGSAIRCDDRNACGHGFERGYSEALVK